MDFSRPSYVRHLARRLLTTLGLSLGSFRVSKIIPNFSPDSLSVNTFGDVGERTCCSRSSSGRSVSVSSGDAFVVVSVDANLPIDGKESGDAIRDSVVWIPFPKAFCRETSDPNERCCCVPSLSNDEGSPIADVVPLLAIANDLVFFAVRLQDEAKHLARLFMVQDFPSACFCRNRLV